MELLNVGSNPSKVDMKWNDVKLSKINADSNASTITREIPLRENLLNAASLSPASDIDWGPQRDPLYIVIPITILYIIIFITGVLGNISTCIVIARNKSMHTATNYYLFSLAISDLLLLVSGLPPDMYAIWYKYPYVFGETFCIMQGFAAETSANATVLTITAFTVERYVAICHPFLSHTMSKLSRAVKYVVVVWLVAMMLAIPQAMSFELYHGTSEDQCVCTVTHTMVPHAFGISTLLFFIMPMSLITVLYILIGLQLHKSTVGPSRGSSMRLKHRVVSYTPASSQPVIVLNANAISGGGVAGGSRLENGTRSEQEEDGRKNFARNAQGTKHVVKMLVAVVVAFFICWAPFHAQRLFAVYSDAPTENMISAYRILNYLSGILYFLSTSINPFLYHIMSHKFREAFKDTFKACSCRQRLAKGSRCYSTLSGRSSQINSHSNTDSYSRQSSLRYLEAEMARLYDSKRPLVVSFKCKQTALPKKPKQVTILDAELQEALDNLNGEAFRDHRRMTTPDLFEKVNYAAPESTQLYPSVHNEKFCKRRSLACDFDLEYGYDSLPNDDGMDHLEHFQEMDKFKDRVHLDRFARTDKEHSNKMSFVEVHSLEPAHLCPVSGSSVRCGALRCCNQCNINNTSRETINPNAVPKCTSSQHRNKLTTDKRVRMKRSKKMYKVSWNNQLTKSSTMPQIVQHASDTNELELCESRNNKHQSGESESDESSNSCLQLEYHCFQQTHQMTAVQELQFENIAHLKI